MSRDKYEFFESELFSAVVVVSLGIFCLYHAYTIESFQIVLIGPRPVPMTIAGMIIGFGVLQFLVAWVGRGENGKAANGKSSALSNTAVFRMAAIIVVGFAYIWLFSATGYLIATAITMASLLIVFGTHKAGRVALLTIIGTAAYYAIFIWLMGIYDPPGWLINLEMLGLL